MTENCLAVEIAYTTEDALHTPTALHMAVPRSATWDYDETGNRLELRCVLEAATLGAATVSALSYGRRALHAADMVAQVKHVAVSAIGEAAG